MINNKKNLEHTIDIKPVSATGTEGSPDNKQRDGHGKKKKGRYTSHGVLSRFLLEALAKAGEDVKKLQRDKRALRKELQPRGKLGELLFHRLWLCHLKTIQIARMEINAVLPEKIP